MALGRPRQFDLDQALDRALEVFWRKGYEGATLPDLTRAMGINRPSLYAAFGNKESLFRQALDRYDAGPAAHLRLALAEPTARRVAERLLAGTIELLCHRRHPRGCLVVQGALACGDEAEPVRQQLVARRTAVLRDLRRRFQRARDEGDLPATASPEALSRFVVTLMQGLAVQAASGANRRQLQQVADLGLRAWPRP